MHNTVEIILIERANAAIAIIDYLRRNSDAAGAKLWVNTTDCIHRDHPRRARKTQRVNISPIIYPMRRHYMPVAMTRNEQQLNTQVGKNTDLDRVSE